MLVGTLVVLVLLIISATVDPRHFWPGDPIKGAFGLTLGEPADAVSMRLTSERNKPKSYFVEPKQPNGLFIYYWIWTAGAKGPILAIEASGRYYGDWTDRLQACLEDLAAVGRWLDKYGYVFKTHKGRRYLVGNGNRTASARCRPLKEESTKKVVGAELVLVLTDDKELGREIESRVKKD